MRYRYSFIISRKNVWQLFILYSCALLYTVFLTPNRYRGDASLQLNLIPVVTTVERFYEQGNQYFWEYYIGYWGNIFGNIFLFIPFGFLLTYLYPKKCFIAVVSYGSLLSISIEIMQLVLRIGVCDIDDVLLNVTGVVTGVVLCRWINQKKPGWFTRVQ